jgi:hypothetical protein
MRIAYALLPRAQSPLPHVSPGHRISECPLSYWPLNCERDVWDTSTPTTNPQAEASVADRVAKGLQEESGLQAMSARVVQLQGSLAAAGDSDIPFRYLDYRPHRSICHTLYVLWRTNPLTRFASSPPALSLEMLYHGRGATC